VKVRWTHEAIAFLEAQEDYSSGLGMASLPKQRKSFVGLPAFTCVFPLRLQAGKSATYTGCCYHGPCLTKSITRSRRTPS
jgi:hypothetical protein